MKSGRQRISSGLGGLGRIGEAGLLTGRANGLGLALPRGEYHEPVDGTTGVVRVDVIRQVWPPMFSITKAGPHSQGPEVVGMTVNVFPRGTKAATDI
jgi:hypothetical protein